MSVKKLITVGRLMKVSEVNKGGDHAVESCNDSAWDDLTGEVLDPKEVRRARMKELGYIHQKRVRKRIPRKEAIKRGYKIIKGRWIDVNKGDTQNPIYRSRYVGKEFNTGDEDGLFASTPPLEALRLLVSDAATIEVGKRANEKVIMLNDVARAFSKLR